MTENHTDVQNVYSELKDKEKKERTKKPYRKNYEDRETKQKDEEINCDSDGFEIVSKNKTKPDDFKPKKRYDGEYRDRNWNQRGGKRGGKRPQAPQEKSQERKESINEENNQQEVDQPVIASEPVKKVDKQIISVIKAKNLKDLLK